MNHEELSALVDEEIESSERGRLLDELGDNADALRTWSRYHLIGETLRSDPAPAAGQPPANVVELPPAAPSRAPLAGLAIAASVALLAVVFVLGRGPATTAPTFELNAAAPPPAQPAEPVATVAAAPVTTPYIDGAGEPAVVRGQERRLNGYLVNFNEQRARVGVPGVHPYVRIVGFDAE